MKNLEGKNLKTLLCIYTKGIYMYIIMYLNDCINALGNHLWKTPVKRPNSFLFPKICKQNCVSVFDRRTDKLYL